MGFKEKRAEWEAIVENVIVDITRQTTPDGIAIRVNMDNLIQEFNGVMTAVERALNSNISVLSPGPREDPEVNHA
jgi:hypothetical protein